MDETIAVIADVHGNTWALDAVLGDIGRRGIERIVNLGDCVYGSLDPAGTAERLMDARIVSVAGNQDRDVFAPTDEVRRSADHRFITSRLSAAQVDWLRGLPPTRVVDDILLCHGTPQSDQTYLLETVTAQGVFLSDTATIMTHLDDAPQKLVLCGHSHVPRMVWLPDGRLIVNPGSVGVSAYEHDVPYPHVMEAGSPHARYAVLTHWPQGWMVEQVAVPYAWDAAAAVARRNGRADRARWIETGRAR
jgi:predicted phosphodiesterase